jgi:dihydrofolate synthase / folylpolyglutamate synthase
VTSALDWLFSLERLGMKFGLKSMSALMRELGDPHRRFASVHVAGTNGKGSVTAMVDAGLRAAGFRSARYTSPHLVRLEERFVVDGREVDTASLERAVARVRAAVDALIAKGELEAPATFFECATAAAFELFASASLDIAVLEVGLGGRLDATNVVTPLICAITTVDFDHQAQLGSTIASIAAEKSGIIKPSVPVVIGNLSGEAKQVVEETARRMDAPVIVSAEAGRLPPGVALSLAGAHQQDNAQVAIAVLRTLRSRGFAIDETAIVEALTTVRWPGRLEHVRRGNCEILLDAAHNPAGAKALAAYLRQSGWIDAVLVFGAMSDKDAHGMLEALLPVTSMAIFTTPPTHRATPAAELARLASTISTKPVETIDDPSDALQRACNVSGRVVAAGSLFLIGPLRGILR